MGRRIVYRIEDRSSNRFTDEEWDEVERLQHWYNSEFFWSTGRLALRRYVVFPNTESSGNSEIPLWDLIAKRHRLLLADGLTEREIVSLMERDKLIIVKRGGYYDNCLASGFTRIADNEWNAYLVCDFLLKASTLIPNATISLADEGRFIKTGLLELRNAIATLPGDEYCSATKAEELCRTRRIFSVVDAEKYKRHPSFGNVIPEFSKLEASEKRVLVRNWNWLGYEGNYEVDGDDRKGFNLNAKVRLFELGRGRSRKRPE